jgi:putative transposase
MSKPISYKRHRFPPEIIVHAVWLYFRFPLSLRLVEERLLERSILVSYETVRRWVLKFGPHTLTASSARDQTVATSGTSTRS